MYILYTYLLVYATAQMYSYGSWRRRTGSGERAKYEPGFMSTINLTVFVRKCLWLVHKAKCVLVLCNMALFLKTQLSFLHAICRISVNP